MNGLDRAIEAAGGTVRFAALLEASAQTVSNWRTRGVPAERCPQIERLTRDLGSPVLCEELRPDVDWAYLRQPVAPAASCAIAFGSGGSG